MGEHRTLGGFYPVPHREKVKSGESLGPINLTQGETIMNTVLQEAAVPTIGTTAEAHSEFSQRYSKAELEEMGSRELLDGYAE